MATQAFADTPGNPVPDFIIPPLITPIAGKVAFVTNPQNTVSSQQFLIDVALSYGGALFTGNPGSTVFPGNITFGPGATDNANPNQLPVLGEMALTRTQPGDFGNNGQRNADFGLAPRNPKNTLGQSFGPEIDIAPLLEDFGSRDITQPALEKTIVINNKGTRHPLSNITVALGSFTPGQFAIVSDSGESTLPSGADRRVVVSFKPTSQGSKSATLTVRSDDVDEPQVELTLFGQGVDLSAPDLEVIPDFVPFGEQEVSAGPTSGQTVTLRNSGSQQPLVISQIVLTGLESDQFAIVSDSGETTLGPGATRTLTVAFDPSSFGFKSTSLFIESNDPDENPTFIFLSGVGRDAAAPDIEITPFFMDFGSQFLNAGPTPSQMLIIKNTGSVQPLAINNFSLTATDPQQFQVLSDTGETVLGPGATRTVLITFDPSIVGFHFNLISIESNDPDEPFTNLGLSGQGVDPELPEIDLNPSFIDFGNRELNSAQSPAQSIVIRNLGTVQPLTIQSLALSGLHHDDFVIVSDSGETVLGPGASRTLSVAFAPVSAGFRFAFLEILSNDPDEGTFSLSLSGFGLVPSGSGTSRLVRINEVMAGLNGDSSIQFVELEVSDDAQKDWGPRGGETVGRAMLVFSDGRGNQIGRFVFPHDAPAGGQTILVATPEFANATGVTPEFFMPQEIMAIAGRVAFKNNPDNTHFNIDIALTYGGAKFIGDPDSAGPTNPDTLPILDAVSLTRVDDVPFGSNHNDAFQSRPPSPRNSSNQTADLEAKPIVDQGLNLFFREKFAGNGRTCSTCHTLEDQFGLSPRTVQLLPPDDPLFVNEFNVNFLFLTSPSQPSDLRGAVTGATGSARILAGTGNQYMIHGGSDLSGTITDQNGNRGDLFTVAPGDLNGPNPLNSSPRGLEDSAMLRGPRALILENIDGFNGLEVFRASPHLLNLELTGPYGLSGEFADLDAFCDGAISQHFPRSLRREPGLDFRPATAAELAAMSAFMKSIRNPADGDFTIGRFATTEAQKRGAQLFFSDQAKCSICHSGPVLSHSGRTISGFATEGLNDNFNTGVANLEINGASKDNLPTEPAGLSHGQSQRKFNTPPLFGIRLTAPYFHDGSATTLADAVRFYDTPQFLSSPSGVQVGTIVAANTPRMVDDLVAFLESLVEIPVEFTRELQFGRHDVTELPVPSMTASIRNTSSTPLIIENVTINGTHALEFNMSNDSGQVTLQPNEIRAVEVTVSPRSFGTKNATLEFTARDDESIGSFSFGVALEVEISSVVGRFIFYNNSAFDSNDPSANAQDDAAIAPDKTALRPGQTASFANYTSYSEGIVGIMVDIANIRGTPTLNDFVFKVGNDNSPGNWALAPAPSISVRPTPGVDGSTRITFIWPERVIRKTWLEVTIQATDVTGLSAPDIFYFGNAVGDCGNDPSNAVVNVTDVALTRANPRSPLLPAPIDFPFDYNRDGVVNVTDTAISRGNQTSPLTGLFLITPP